MKRALWSKGMGKAGLALLFVATSVFAQQDAKPNAEMKFRKASQLTAQEQLAQAATYIRRMKGTLKTVNKISERARADKDIIKLNCVNDKLIQIKGNLRLGEQSRDAMKVAAARNDTGARSHEFSKLTITYQKVIVLGEEAEACIGEEIAYVGTTKVDVSVDPDIPQEDPTITEPPMAPLIRPPVASPFL